MRATAPAAPPLFAAGLLVRRLLFETADLRSGVSVVLIAATTVRSRGADLFFQTVHGAVCRPAGARSAAKLAAAAARSAYLLGQEPQRWRGGARGASRAVYSQPTGFFFGSTLPLARRCCSAWRNLEYYYIII